MAVVGISLGRFDAEQYPEQMASLKVMLDLASGFVGVGVQSQRPKINHHILWTV